MLGTVLSTEDTNIKDALQTLEGKGGKGQVFTK